MRPRPDLKLVPPPSPLPLPFLRVLSEVSATLRAASKRVGRSFSNSEFARTQAHHSQGRRAPGGWTRGRHTSIAPSSRFAQFLFPTFECHFASAVCFDLPASISSNSKSVALFK